MYPSSSITDAQWAVLEPLLPAPGNTRDRGGRREKHPRRLILDAIFYLVRLLPQRLSAPNRCAVPIPSRRWVVECTFAWISRHRRCVRDYETLPEQHETMVYIAMIMTMSRRLARTGDW